MKISEEFSKLYPGKEFGYEARIRYSGRFKDYNANVRFTISRITFNLSKAWKGVDDEIKAGLIHELLAKIFRKRLGPPRKTGNIELYNSFIRNLHKYTPVTRTDAVLRESFDRVNKEYFFGMIQRTNLVFGSHSKAKLGSYEYHTDTISISRIFEDADAELLDYVMYHEMLHKKIKFTAKHGRSFHHTPEFRRKEKEFENADIIEKRISSFAAGKRRGAFPGPQSFISRIFGQG